MRDLARTVGFPGRSAVTKIAIDLDSRLGTLDSRVFSHFVEHMGRGVYGGLCDDAGRLIPRIAELVEALEPALIRYPGGCFAAEYHWWEGVGAQRTSGIDTFWSRVGLSELETNAFGTDEFLDFCTRVGAVPYLTVNMGTGNPAEAAEWVRYTGGRVGTWSLGNEVFGPWETGHQGPVEYARRAEVFADSMLAADPDIDFVGVGADSRNYLNWNENVLDRIGKRIRWLSLHFYAPGPEAGCLEDTRDGYMTVTAAAYTLGLVLDEMIALIRARDLPARLALDEWAVWSCDDELRGAADSGESSPMRDALFAASVFHRIIERAHWVTMACYAQLVNVLGLIQTEEDGCFVTPVYHVFKLYRDAAGKEAVRVTVDGSPTFEAPELGRMPRAFEVPFVEAVGLVDDSGEVTLYAINRHPSMGIDVVVEGWYGNVQVETLAGDGPFARNSFAEPDRVQPVTSTVTLPYVQLPPHSITRFELERS